MKTLHLHKGVTLTNKGVSVRRTAFANLSEVTALLETGEQVLATYDESLADRRRKQLRKAFLRFESRRHGGSQVFDVYVKIDPNSREGREIRREIANERLRKAL